jgi:hypothetical protein
MKPGCVNPREVLKSLGKDNRVGKSQGSYFFVVISTVGRVKQKIEEMHGLYREESVTKGLATATGASKLRNSTLSSTSTVCVAFSAATPS